MDLSSPTSRWILVGLAVALLLAGERFLRLPLGSVVLGYCVIGLSPDRVGGEVQIAPAEVVAAGTLGALVLRKRRLTVGTEALRTARVPVIAWLAFGIALALGTVYAQLAGPDLTVSAVGELLRWWLAPALCLAALLRQPRWPAGATLGLVLAGLLHALVIVHQSLTENQFNARPYGLLASGASLHGEIIANPNAAGVAAGLVATFALGLTILLGRRPELAPSNAGKPVSWAFGGVVLLVSLGAVLTLSRSAWILLAVGSVVLAWRARAKLVLALLLVGAVTVLVLPSTQGRLLRSFSDKASPDFTGVSPEARAAGRSVERASIAARGDAWQLAWREGRRRNLVIGSGPQALFRSAGTPADNSYLEGFVDAGAIGALALLALALSAPLALARLGAALGTEAAIGSFGVASLFGNYWFDPRLLFLCMLIGGLGVALAQADRRFSDARGSSRDSRPAHGPANTSAPSEDPVPASGF